METKVCRVCGIEKGLHDFNKHPNCKLGVNTRCRSCQQDYRKTYRANNLEKIKEADCKYFKKNREKLMIKSREYSKNNRKKILELNRRHYRKNAEKINERTLKLYYLYYREKEVEQLSDRYVKKLICRHSGIRPSACTTELIELKRIIIKTKRLCKTSKNLETA